MIKENKKEKKYRFWKGFGIITIISFVLFIAVVGLYSKSEFGFNIKRLVRENLLGITSSQEDPSTGYSDPDADAGPNEWYTSWPEGGHYEVIDDGTIPDTNDYIYETGSTTDGAIDVFTMTTFSMSGGSTNFIKIWAYGSGGNYNEADIYADIYIAGSWQGNGVIIPAGSPDGWYSKTFTGTWTQAQLDDLQVKLTYVFINMVVFDVYVYSMYAEIDYTIPAGGDIPTVNLLLPANSSNTTSTINSFSSEYTDAGGLRNATLYIWNSTNSIINTTTQTKTGTYNSSIIPVTLPYQGTFLWNYYVCDNETITNCAFNSTNWSLTLTTSVSACGILNMENSIYTLTANVSSLDRCFTIGANNVSLNCQGYEINYSSDGGDDEFGIYSNQNYTTIKNCVVKEGLPAGDSGHAIAFYNAKNGIINNNTIITSGIDSYGIFLFLNPSSNSSNTFTNNTITISGNGGKGIHLEYAKSNTLSNNTITILGNSAEGIYLTASANSNTISNNTIINNGNDGHGIYLSLSYINTITGNIVKTINETTHVVYLFNSGNNTFYNNLFNASQVIPVYSTNNLTNFWNTTKTLGTNIVGGSYLGGNYWTNLSGTGYSDTCTDADVDGICDLQYNLTGNNIDFLSLTFLILDTCTYTSGNWNVDCSDNCVIITDTNLNENNLSIIGTGKFRLTKNITNYNQIFVSDNCELFVESGGYLK